MTQLPQISEVDAPSAPRLHVNLISADRERRDELMNRLEHDGRFTLAARAERPDAECGVLALDVAGLEPHAVELVSRISLRRDRLLAIVKDEDDISFAMRLVLAGASGITSLRQPSSCICQAVVDVAAGMASVSAALETQLVRRLQALPRD